MLRNTQQQKYHKQTFQDATNGGKSKTKFETTACALPGIVRHSSQIILFIHALHIYTTFFLSLLARFMLRSFMLKKLLLKPLKSKCMSILFRSEDKQLLTGNIQIMITFD